ncbi:MAG TPA: recombination protein O N-terminal domain-containing protein [Candidatus Paceibacterota bacterium]
MRHKYETRGIVLSRSPLGEANMFVTILTPELGLVRARAQGLRKPGAKLAAALATFAESDVILVRGKESWRVAGAILVENWFTRLDRAEPRTRAARVSTLVLRLVAGEMHDPGPLPILRGFFDALTTLPENAHEALEILAVLHILAVLGLDGGEIPGGPSTFTLPFLAEILKNRTSYITRINNGISASGL